MSQHRRSDDENLLVYARRLVRGEHVLTSVRRIAAAYAVCLGVWGGSLIFFPDATAYENAVFDGIFTAALPQVWGGAFWIASCLMLATTISARATVYVLAVMFTGGILTGWVIGVIAQTLVDPNAHLTGGALALYGMAYTGLASAVWSQRTIEHERLILERTPDGRVVPLVEADRRAG